MFLIMCKLNDNNDFKIMQSVFLRQIKVMSLIISIMLYLLWGASKKTINY